MPAAIQTIGATPEVVGTGTGARTALVIQNETGSGGDIRWGFDDDISDTVGILLAEGDAPISFTGNGSDSLGAGPIYAVRVTGDVDLQVVER